MTEAACATVACPVSTAYITRFIASMPVIWVFASLRFWHPRWPIVPHLKRSVTASAPKNTAAPMPAVSSPVASAPVTEAPVNAAPPAAVPRPRPVFSANPTACCPRTFGGPPAAVCWGATVICPRGLACATSAPGAAGCAVCLERKKKNPAMAASTQGMLFRNHVEGEGDQQEQHERASGEASAQARHVQRHRITVRPELIRAWNCLRLRHAGGCSAENRGRIACEARKERSQTGSARAARRGNYIRGIADAKFRCRGAFHRTR